jgi:hypothetical protein
MHAHLIAVEVELKHQHLLRINHASSCGAARQGDCQDVRLCAPAVIGMLEIQCGAKLGV